MTLCHSVFNAWSKTTLLLPVWPRVAKRLDTHYTVLCKGLENLQIWVSMGILGPIPFGKGMTEF